MQARTQDACSELMTRLINHQMSWPFLSPDFVLDSTFFGKFRKRRCGHHANRPVAPVMPPSAPAAAGEAARFEGLVSLKDRLAAGSVPTVDVFIDEVVQVGRAVVVYTSTYGILSANTRRWAC